MEEIVQEPREEIKDIVQLLLVGNEFFALDKGGRIWFCERKLSRCLAIEEGKDDEFHGWYRFPLDTCLQFCRDDERNEEHRQIVRARRKFKDPTKQFIELCPHWGHDLLCDIFINDKSISWSVDANHNIIFTSFVEIDSNTHAVILDMTKKLWFKNIKIIAPEGSKIEPSIWDL